MNKKCILLLFLISSLFSKDNITIDFGSNVYNTFTSYGISDVNSYSSTVYSSSMDWDEDDDDDYKKYYGGGEYGDKDGHYGPSVPEPSTYALIAGMAGLLFAIYKRKN